MREDGRMVKELLTTGELAGVLKVHRCTIARWLKEDLVPVVRLPHGQTRFNLEQVLEALHRLAAAKTEEVQAEGPKRQAAVRGR